MEFKAEGNKLYSQGKVRQSVEAYTKGIDLVEMEAEGMSGEAMGCVHLLYSNRSMAHLDLFMVDEALQDAECAIEANPEYGKAYLRRASVLLDLFDFKAALKDLDKAEELEPGLAPEGCEGRLRALGQKWVPNCYLKKQMELRKDYRCDYVLMLEFEGEDIVEPIFLPRFRGTGVNDSFVPTLNSLFRTGSCANIGPMSGERTCYIILVNHQLTKIKARVNDTSAFMKMVGEQLIREFGPKDDFSATGIAQIVLNHPEKRKDYYIAASVEVLDRVILKMPTESSILFVGLLLPGSPKWMQEALHPKFLKEIQTHVTKLADFTQGDLAAFVSSVETVRRPYFKKDREKKCHGCGIAISDPDPQECICGHMYCSPFCHSDHSLSHSGECKKIMQALGDSHNLYVMFTGLYWQKVYDGVFPCKDEPDAVALWKERNMPDDNSPSSRQKEADFYLEIETEAMNEDMKQSGFAARNPDQLPDPRMSKKLSEQMLKRWFHAMGTPLDTDSLPRLQAKAIMAMKLDVYWRECTKSLTAKQRNDLTPLTEAMKNISAHLTKRVIAKQLGADEYLAWIQREYAAHCDHPGSRIDDRI